MSTADFKAALARYDALVSWFPEVARKGKANPYTSLNGNMFSFLSRDGVLCFRYGEQERVALAEEFGTAPVLQYGAVMKGYVAMSEAICAKPEALAAHFERSLAYARTLAVK